MDREPAWHAQRLEVDAQNSINEAWWYMVVIPALRRLKKEDQKFLVILRYIENLKAAWDI